MVCSVDIILRGKGRSGCDFQSKGSEGDFAVEFDGLGDSRSCDVRPCRKQCENIGMALECTSSYLKDSLAVFRYYKSLAERAMAQLSDGQLIAVLDEESNSIALIVKHMAGNMRSRFTDFLTTDGEKPDRHRDLEFIDPPQSREALMTMWQTGWDCLFAALAPLQEEDMARIVTIRGEAHSVMQAINRQVAHYSYHCGQIVLLAKHLGAPGWKPLTVPRGQSEQFNERVRSGNVSQR
jgi:uncharacterized damage-inducible protein DinB